MSTRPDNGNDTSDLRQVERAYRKLGAEEPPGLLDQAVLNRARGAVGQRRPWSWNLSWYHTVGTAAGVLLAVGVYLQMRDEVPKLPHPAQSTPRATVRQEQQQERGAAPAAETDAIGELEDRRRDLQPQVESFALPASESAEPLGSEPPLAESKDDLHSKQALLKRQAEEERLPEPEQWFERLEALRAAGREKDFRQQLEAFRRAYPDYPLPEDWPD